MTLLIYCTLKIYSNQLDVWLTVAEYGEWTSIPKAKSVNQSFHTSDESALLYARRIFGAASKCHKKTIEFYAMIGENLVVNYNKWQNNACCKKPLLNDLTFRMPAQHTSSEVTVRCIIQQDLNAKEKDKWEMKKRKRVARTFFFTSLLFLLFTWRHRLCKFGDPPCWCPSKRVITCKYREI